jgi:tetratricopeptide (TPR) repeat protein
MVKYKGQRYCDIKKAMNLSSLCDPAGIRTQDPYIKSVLLYQLSYGIENDSKTISQKLSDPAGIRTQDPYIKSVLLYQLSYGIKKIYGLSQMRMQNYEKIIRMQKTFFKLLILFLGVLIQSLDCKAQNDVAKKADSLFSASKYEEAAKIYEIIFADNAVNKENIALKLAYINENLGDFPKAIYYLNDYYNLNPKDEVFEKMNKMALENKFTGFERSDLNFALVIYQQYYVYILYSVIFIGVFILFILFRKKIYNIDILKRHLILVALYLVFLLVFINLPKTYQSAIVNKKSFFRSFPSSGSPIVGSIDKGNKINIFGQEDVWLKVLWERKIVYINKKDTWILNS